MNAPAAYTVPVNYTNWVQGCISPASGTKGAGQLLFDEWSRLKGGSF
jgi:hypothetical protein